MTEERVEALQQALAEAISVAANKAAADGLHPAVVAMVIAAEAGNHLHSVQTCDHKREAMLGGLQEAMRLGFEMSKPHGGMQ